MKRTVVLILTVILTAAIAVSCAAPETSPSGIPVSTPQPTTEPTPVPTTTPEPTPTPRPADMSYTTGLHFEGEYKPVMCVVENSPAARPQTGLQTADVVYEVPVEGSITRFVCVFSDNIPESVMPVRSGRVPFLFIQQEWDAVFMHYGGSGNKASAAYTFYANALHDRIKIDLDGISGYSDIYHRVSGKTAPHNVSGNVLLAQQKYNYSPTPLNWEFDSNAVYQGDDVTEIKLAMTSNEEDFVSYKYDSAQDVYLRFMGGKEFKSAETGKQVSVKNVIVQYSSYKVQAQKYKDWNMLGTGNADFYIGGKHIRGTWTKSAPETQTMYCDDKGQPIVLRPGNTWIELTTEK